MVTRPFVENVLLLVLTAVLTGLLVPYINRKFEERRALERTRAEAQIAREGSIVRTREEFLSELELLLSNFHSRAAAVAWYRSTSKNPARYAVAVEEYDSAAWEFTRKIHAATSRAGRFTSPGALYALKQHQGEWHALDLDIQRLIDGNGSEEDWRGMLERINGQLTRTGVVAEMLASDYGLRPPLAE